jgi:hypothetical protein
MEDTLRRGLGDRLEVGGGALFGKLVPLGRGHFLEPLRERLGFVLRPLLGFRDGGDEGLASVARDELALRTKLESGHGCQSPEMEFSEKRAGGARAVQNGSGRFDWGD